MGIFTHEIINPSKTLEERLRPNFNICVTGALLGRTSFVSPCAIQEELLAKAPEALGKEATYRWFKLIAGQFSCNTVFVLQFSSVFSRVFQSISQAAGHISHVRVWVQRTNSSTWSICCFVVCLLPQPSGAWVNLIVLSLSLTGRFSKDIGPGTSLV